MHHSCTHGTMCYISSSIFHSLFYDSPLSLLKQVRMPTVETVPVSAGEKEELSAGQGLLMM
jgi:hypothetical protein